MSDRERQAEEAEDVAIVTRLDQAWNQAYVSGDRSALRDILSDDFVAVAHTGQLVSKAQLIQPPAEPAIEVRFSDFGLRCWGPTATTCGRIYVLTPSMTIEQRFMRVYAKRAGVWQAVSVQVVPVPGREPALPPPPLTSASTD